MQVNKSDRNDAAGIARIMQTGWFKEVRVKDIDSHVRRPQHALCREGETQTQVQRRHPRQQCWPEVSADRFVRWLS
jgi:hypothetical protein